MHLSAELSFGLMYGTVDNALCGWGNAVSVVLGCSMSVTETVFVGNLYQRIMRFFCVLNRTAFMGVN